mmetsp:Transcript_132576/g.334906  ORF Transcript_132576/g.334906 Transcript_132576/m.334906 type:complete len:243 (-) Transcript_132576:8-736(-)
MKRQGYVDPLADHGRHVEVRAQHALGLEARGRELEGVGDVASNGGDRSPHHTEAAAVQHERGVGEQACLVDAFELQAVAQLRRRPVVHRDLAEGVHAEQVRVHREPLRHRGEGAFQRSPTRRAVSMEEVLELLTPIARIVEVGRPGGMQLEAVVHDAILSRDFCSADVNAVACEQLAQLKEQPNLVIAEHVQPPDEWVLPVCEESHRPIRQHPRGHCSVARSRQRSYRCSGAPTVAAATTLQ